MRRVLLIQPYVPQYRVPLFRLMKRSLKEQNIELRIAAAQPHGEQLLRDDAASEIELDYKLDSKTVTAGKFELNIRYVSSVLRDFQPEFIIAEQAIKNIENFYLLIRKNLKPSYQFAFWGHGRSFSNQQHQFLAEVKSKLTNQVDWFFAYTDKGGKAVSNNGFPLERITVLNNSNDVESLREELNSISGDELTAFRESNSLTQGMTACFIGGVDERKGIRFLIDSSKLIKASNPDFTLVIAGNGSLVSEVIEFESSGAPVKYIGRVDGKEKALLLKSSDVMLIPRWIGLVALDSLASGCPIFTTESTTHSPEFDYLVPGRNCEISSDTLDAYVGLVSSALNNQGSLVDLSRNAITDSYQYSISAMAARFSAGITSWIQSQ